MIWRRLTLATVPAAVLALGLISPDAVAPTLIAPIGTLANFVFYGLVGAVGLWSLLLLLSTFVSDNRVFEDRFGSVVLGIMLLVTTVVLVATSPATLRLADRVCLGLVDLPPLAVAFGALAGLAVLLAASVAVVWLMVLGMLADHPTKESAPPGRGARLDTGRFER